MITESQLSQALELAKDCMMEAAEAERRGLLGTAEARRTAALALFDSWARLAVEYERQQLEVPEEY